MATHNVGESVTPPTTRRRGQEFLSVKNFERYQHYKKRSPPWIKLYYDILNDPDFLALDAVQRGHYLTFLLVASRQNNLIPNDPIYIQLTMRLTYKPDLTPLINAGFLIASRKLRTSTMIAPCKQNALSETETETETEKKEREEKRERESERERDATQKKNAAHPKLVDEEFLLAQEQSPAYGGAGINVRIEYEKCKTWMTAHERTATKRAFLNWLNKAEPTKQPQTDHTGKYAGVTQC